MRWRGWWHRRTVLGSDAVRLYTHCGAPVFDAHRVLVRVACPAVLCGPVPVIGGNRIGKHDTGGGAVTVGRASSTTGTTGPDTSVSSSHDHRLRSPQPEEADVHLSVHLEGVRMDFAACLTAALLFVQDFGGHHYPDTVAVLFGDTTGLRRLPMNASTSNPDESNGSRLVPGTEGVRRGRSSAPAIPMPNPGSVISFERSCTATPARLPPGSDSGESRTHPRCAAAIDKKPIGTLTMVGPSAELGRG
jgi:hypothetical protein